MKVTQDPEKKTAAQLIDAKLAEGFFYVKSLGTSDRKTLLWVDIAGMTYIYEKAPGGDPIAAVASTFEKMLKKGGGGRALAWLKKNTSLRGKVPTSKAKSQMKEGIALADLTLPGDEGFVQHAGESEWEAIVNHNSFDIEDEDKAEKLINAYLDRHRSASLGESVVTFKDRGVGTKATVAVYVDGKVYTEVRRIAGRYHEVDRYGKLTGRAWRNFADIKMEFSEPLGEGKGAPGKRDGTGPAKGSFQRSKSKKGKRGGPKPGCKPDDVEEAELIPGVQLIARKYGMDAGQLNRAFQGAQPTSALLVMGVISDLYGSFLASKVNKLHLDRIAMYFKERG